MFACKLSSTGGAYWERGGGGSFLFIRWTVDVFVIHADDASGRSSLTFACKSISAQSVLIDTYACLECILVRGMYVCAHYTGRVDCRNGQTFVNYRNWQQYFFIPTIRTFDDYIIIYYCYFIVRVEPLPAWTGDNKHAAYTSCVTQNGKLINVTRFHNVRHVEFAVITFLWYIKLD